MGKNVPRETQVSLTPEQMEMVQSLLYSTAHGEGDPEQRAFLDTLCDVFEDAAENEAPAPAPAPPRVCQNTPNTLRDLADHIEARNARHARLLFCVGALSGSLTSTEPGHLTFTAAMLQLFDAAGMAKADTWPSTTIKAMEAAPNLLATCKAILQGRTLPPSWEQLLRAAIARAEGRPMETTPATERDIHAAIYLSELLHGNYEVHHHIPGEAIVCCVPSVAIGNAIVRALRARQSERIAAEIKRRASHADARRRCDAQAHPHDPGDAERAGRADIPSGN